MWILREKENYSFELIDRYNTAAMVKIERLSEALFPVSGVFWSNDNNNRKKNPRFS